MRGFVFSLAVALLASIPACCDSECCKAEAPAKAEVAQPVECCDASTCGCVSCECDADSRCEGCDAKQAKGDAPKSGEVTPPEDGGKYHVSLFLSDSPTAADQQLVSWFSSSGHPRLHEIAAKSHYHRFTPSHDIYKTRLAKYIASHEFPAVWIQRADGAVIYKASGANLPSSPAAMAEEIDYYGTLQPYYASKGTSNVPDSADHYGRLVPRAQCPDGTCGPFDRIRPDGGGAVGPILDSVELFPRPLKAVTNAVPWIIGGCGVIAVLMLIGFAGLGLLAVGAYVLRQSRLPAAQ